MRGLMNAAAVAATVGVLFLGTAANADFAVDFESYSLGNINGQGPWVDFGGTLTPDVSNAQALSGTQSLALSTAIGGGYGSDVYVANADGAPVTSGVWTMSFWTYVPQSFDGEAVLYESQGPMPTTFERGARLRINNLSGAAVFENQTGGATQPLVFDQWAQVQLDIDLDGNTLDVYYNGGLVSSSAWDIDNPGAPSIGGFNWWADGGTVQSTVYIDDYSLTEVPEPAMLALVGFVGLATLGRRRRQH